MFIFTLANAYSKNLNHQVAINPKQIAAIYKERNPDKADDNEVTIVLANDRQYTVYYSDFETLVRLVDERK
jgi:hypothetical protein